jgi:hypothetical protein
LKKGKNAENGLNNVFGTKEARMKNSIAKLNDEISQIRTKLNGGWSDTWMVYCNGRDVLKQFLEKMKNANRLRTSVIWPL